MATGDEKKATQLMWIVGIAFGAMLGIGGTVTLSYGATKQQTEENTRDIQALQRKTVDYIYIQDLIESNLLMVDILKSKPDSPEMDIALKAWKDFQTSTMRRANPTRSMSGGGNSNGSK